MASINLGRVVGDTGPKGDRGTVWYLGTGVTGQSTDGTVFSGSGVESAILQDMYLNTDTDDFYVCVLAGDANTAEWAYAGNLRGATGPQGAVGPTGQVDSNTPVEFEEASTEADINSGETLSTLMGKIKKSISTFRSAIGTLSDLGTSAKSSLVEAINEIFAANNDLWKKIYPVGSIYMTTDNTNPETFWGGTWVAWGAGRVPVGVNTADDAFNAVEMTGGAATVDLSHSHTVDSHSHTISHTHPTLDHALTVDEMPAHTHGEYINMLTDTDTGTSISRPLASAQIDFNNAGSYKALQETCGAWSYSSGHLQTGETGGGQGHNHGDTGSASTSDSGNTSPGTDNQLGNQSILQPYITCYMWKRTA